MRSRRSSVLALDLYARRVHGLRGEVRSEYVADGESRARAGDPGIHPLARCRCCATAMSSCRIEGIATYPIAASRGRMSSRRIPHPPRSPSNGSRCNTLIDRTLIRPYLYAYIAPRAADAGLTGSDRRRDAGRCVSRSGFGQAVAERLFVGHEFPSADINLLPISIDRPSPGRRGGIAAATHLARYYERHATRPVLRAPSRPPAHTGRAKSG